MTRGVRWYLVSSLVLVALIAVAGCSHYMMAEREPWRAEAESSCLNSGAVKESASRVRIAAIDGPGACGITYPLRVSSARRAVPRSAMTTSRCGRRAPFRTARTARCRRAGRARIQTRATDRVTGSKAARRIRRPIARARSSRARCRRLSKTGSNIIPTNTPPYQQSPLSDPARNHIRHVLSGAATLFIAALSAEHLRRRRAHKPARRCRFNRRDCRSRTTTKTSAFRAARRIRITAARCGALFVAPSRAASVAAARSARSAR